MPKKRTKVADKHQRGTSEKPLEKPSKNKNMVKRLTKRLAM